MPPVTQPTEQERAVSSIAQARANLNAGGVRQGRTIQPAVSANELVNPPAPIQPPVPRVNTNDGSRTNNLIQNTANNTQSFIQSESENARRRDEIAGLLGEQQFDAAGQRAQLTEQFGVTGNLTRLQDIQTQLAQANTQSALTQTRIEGAAGQTLGQAQREVTQEQRENAVRNAGLAAEANVLQGNIETASTLINNAMQDYYSDRQLKNQNMIQQLEYFSGLADQETAQLLRNEQRVYEEDQAKLTRVLNGVDSALQSGAATANEIKLLTNPNTSDDERLALAQLIQSRGATEMRDLTLQSTRLDMAVKAEQLAKLRQPTVATRETSVVDVNGTKQLIDTQTGEVIASFGGDVSVNEVVQAKQAHFVNTLDNLKTHPGMAKAVGTTPLARFTPFKADVMTGQVADFTGSVSNIVKQLTLNTFAEAKERGLTFGAASEGEWQILSDSATKISNWERERDDGSVYYAVSEDLFKKELDVLSNFGKMDSIRKGINPADIGVLDLGNGLFATQNSDGTFTEFTINSVGNIVQQ